MVKGDFHCFVCGSSRERLESYATCASWDYYRCLNCGLIFLGPAPQERDLQIYYNDAYAVRPEAYQRGAKQSAPIILRKLEERLPHKGKLLEVGCSYGYFLDAARRIGWGVTGIELAGDAAAYGREKLGLQILSGTLESVLGQLQPPYDVIATFHVIEHVLDPMGFLRACRKVLRDGGVLILKTPNVASWISKQAGRYWEWLSPPAHIHLLSPASLELALRQSGFRVEEICSRRGDANNNLFELICALGKYMLRRNGKQMGSGNQRRGLADRWQVKAVKTASEVIYYPLELVVDPFLGRKGLQPELLAIARA